MEVALRLLSEQGSDVALGSSILFGSMIQWLRPMPAGYVLDLHPMAVAGWVGLLVTSLNLLPISQLDGGHVLYAMIRRGQHTVATLLLFGALVLIALNPRALYGWTLMVLLLMFLGPKHPPTANDAEPLGLGRMVLGWLTLAFLFVGFTPQPFVEVRAPKLRPVPVQQGQTIEVRLDQNSILRNARMPIQSGRTVARTPNRALLPSPAKNQSRSQDCTLKRAGTKGMG